MSPGVFIKWNDPGKQLSPKSKCNSNDCISHADVTCLKCFTKILNFFQFCAGCQIHLKKELHAKKFLFFSKRHSDINSASGYGRRLCGRTLVICFRRIFENKKRGTNSYFKSRLWKCKLIAKCKL